MPEILDSFFDAVIVLDAEGNILGASGGCSDFQPAGNAGMDPGINYLEACLRAAGNDEALISKAGEGIRRVICGKAEKFEMEYACHSSPQQRWFLLRAIPLKHMSQILLSHIDITDRKLSELEAKQKSDELSRQNESLRIALYKIAHDIQAPLNSIKGLIGLNGSSTLTAPQTIGMIDKGVSRLGHFVEEALHNGLHSVLRPVAAAVNFKSLLDEVHDAVRYNTAGFFVSIKTSVVQQEDFISDGFELKTILLNLVANALKYADRDKADPFVHVSIRANGREAELVVADNGIGMDEISIKKIYDYRFKISGSSSGWGIGLYLVRMALEKLGGSIEVQSELCRGTTFTCKIPALHHPLR